MKNRSRFWVYLLIQIVVFAMLTSSCKKKEDSTNTNPPATLRVPVVTTNVISNITQTTATCGGVVNSQGSSTISSRGVCWSTTENPTILNLITTDGSGAGTFTSSITGLFTITPYYVRAYATNSVGTGYGNQVSFTTKQDSSGTTVSIGWLKNWYNANHTADTLRITSDFIIEAIISANDESGNIYRTLYFQDNTGGITISLNQTSLYYQFPVGQKIHIKCKDLYLGTYGTAIQLGYPYQGKIGRIPASMIASHVLPDGLPGPHPQPVVINAGHIPDITILTNLVCSLVAINGVSFPDAGLPFCITGNSSTSRAIADSAGTAITNPNVWVVYTSTYANFKAVLLPSGVGTLRGILTVYNGKFEMIVRDTTDLINFHRVN